MKKLFGLFLFLFSPVALSQPTFYHCIKDGEGVISPQPCESSGMREQTQYEINQWKRIRTCTELSRLKEQVIARQQKQGSQDANDDLRTIDDEGRRLRCGL